MAEITLTPKDLPVIPLEVEISPDNIAGKSIDDIKKFTILKGNKERELGEFFDVKGSSGNFTVKIHKKARYVDLQNCIGCDACFEPCPISLKNEFEEGLSERKAIYVPCAGALPNVPMIDTEHCLRFKGKDCKACQ